MSYRKLKDDSEKEINEFFKDNGFFAFNQKQLEEGMEKVKANAENKVTKMGAGSFILSSKVPDFVKGSEERRDKIKEYIFGNYDQAYDAFCYELNNHEYCITWDPEPTLDALGLKMEEIEAVPEIYKAWKDAVKYNKIER